ncbi:MAG: glycoside hydrolase family 65 protein [Flexilinea sp.]
MEKRADNHFVIDPWRVIEDDFTPEHSLESESIFSLGNEYMGIRGFFEEGYTGKSMVGCYFNGIYEQMPVPDQGYKGIIRKTEFMVNAVNWLYTRIRIDGETLDLNTSSYEGFSRVLDLRTGVLIRKFIWTTKQGKRIHIEFERFLSMENANFAGQRIRLLPINFDSDISVETGLDFSIPHYSKDENFWNIGSAGSDTNSLHTLGTTKTTGQSVFSCCTVTAESACEKVVKQEPQQISLIFTIPLHRGSESVISKVIGNFADKIPDDTRQEDFNLQCSRLAALAAATDYDDLLQANALWWLKIWEKSDIVINGDPANQQGIRYCIFQMVQSYHGADESNNVGAKGLTGEAYNGNAFWDTEVYCLPFYIFTNLKAAKNLLLYRFNTLGEAKNRAKDLDCDGAFYPVATISGRECCSLWQHASLQLQASTAVIYGFWLYENMTGDRAFLYTKGLPVMLEVCKMLATRGDFDPSGKHYGFYGVMGPDEFQMMVNNNFYTNYMAKMTFAYTLSTIREYGRENVEGCTELLRAAEIDQSTLHRWSEMEKKVFIPYDERTKLFEQHEGYFKLPHIDLNTIPIEEFPLYNHWSYDRIYRNDMIKQPDVLMLMLLHGSQFSEEQLLANYEYYEPRCIHESSLSPSVHSILAARLKKHKEAYSLFRFATRMDLDNYNRNTSEGLHITSIAGAWMNIVYGFGGMRSDEEQLSFYPSIPKQWTSYSFRITYKDKVIAVSVSKEKAAFSILNNGTVEIAVFGKTVTLGKEVQIFDIPQEWQG